MKTVHLIFNSHIDPIWCWPWQSGLDEILATCRSACDRLDAHPDLFFSKGEAWGYKKIEEMDERLFERIHQHVRNKRWEIVGGWWIQPDCNLPSGFALEKQILLGKAYFLERFGAFPRTAYNVDTFGHAATLPGYMKAVGQDRYIMMRPEEKKLKLPARLFRWRGYQDGPEVVTFRIAEAYQTSNGITLDHVKASLTHLPEGIDHTMCFVGIGDHGGGPTEHLIDWCRKHADAFEGARLIFSTPSRYFDAITAQVDKLPLVVGELNTVFVGCHTVHRATKTGVRKAEHALFQAELMAKEEKHLAANKLLPTAWEQVCFHHFHDTLGGTCIPSSYEQVSAQLGLSSAVADEILHLGLRRKLSALPDCVRQRIVLYNASDKPFDGYIEYEPWFDFQIWTPQFRVLDEIGTAIPFQKLPAEAMNIDFPRLLFQRRIEPGQWRILEIDIDHTEDVGPLSSIEVRGTEMIHRDLTAWSEKNLRFAKTLLPLPQLELVHDQSDTWGEDIDRYEEKTVDEAHWEPTRIVDQGPVMGSAFRDGTIGSSRLRAEWRIYADAPFIELILGVHWLEKHKVLKFRWNLPGVASQRMDGILGGQLRRTNNGKEFPLRDWSLLENDSGVKTGIVCPDVFACDATPERIRLTLLRSPFLAHQAPHPGDMPRAVVADQGFHQFRFRFFHGEAVTEELLESHGLMLQRPPIMADLTRGMPLRTIEKIRFRKEELNSPSDLS